MDNRLRDLPEWMKGYIAGIIDGEGTISLKMDRLREHHWTPYLLITSTTQEMVLRISNALALGQTYTKNANELRGHFGKKPICGWTCQSVIEVWFVLDAVRDYLLIKRKQADLIMEFCELKIGKVISNMDCIRIYNELKKLNGRPGSELIT